MASRPAQQELRPIHEINLHRQSYRRSSYLTSSSYSTPPRTSSYSGLSDYSSRKSYSGILSHSGSYPDFKSYTSPSYSSSSDTYSSRRRYDGYSSLSPVSQSSYSTRSPDGASSSYSSRRQPAGSASNLPTGSVSLDTADLRSVQERVDKITSIDELQLLLTSNDKFEERKILRAAIRNLRDKREEEATADMSSYRSYRSDQSVDHRSARSTVSTPVQPDTETDYSLIQDENELKRLLNKSDDYFEKKKIRAAMRELRKKREETSRSATSHTYQSARLSNRSAEEIEEKETKQCPSSTQEKVSEETDILNNSGDMSLMEKLLEETKDLDKRREIRSAMRELRAQIREGKMKPNSRETLSFNKNMNDMSGEETKTQPSDHSNETPEKASNNRPESLDVLVKKEEDGSVVIENTQILDDATCTVKMRSKHSRTTSHSDLYEKATTFTKEIMSPGGTKFIEQDDVVTKTKKSVRGSMYNETDMTMKKLVRTVSGSEYAETDILIETDSSSVSTGEKTSNSVEMRMTFDKLSENSLGSIVEGKELDLGRKTASDLESNNNQLKALSTNQESSGYGSSEDVENTKDDVFDSPSKDKPRIMMELVDKYVYDGDTVVMECKVAAVDSDSVVTWHRSDKVLKATKDFVQSFDGGTAKLVICEVFPDDSGCYKCVIKSGGDQLETKANLTVQDNPNVTAPSFTKPLSDMQTQDGDTVTFSIEVIGQPQPIIKWYKEAKLLKKSADYQQKFDGVKATLVIDEVFPDDSGVYACSATNQAGDVRTSATLTVTDKPSATKTEAPKVILPLKNQEVTDGDRVVLECGVSGKPEPKIFWYKKDKLVKQSEDFNMTYDGTTATLTIFEVFPEDGCLYECVAENSAGEVTSEMTLTVKDAVKKVAPKFTQQLVNNSVKDGYPVMFECSMTGQPEPMVVWRHNGKAIQPSRDVRITLNGGAAVLELGEALHPESSGQYSCCATNSEGEATTTCSLVIEENKDIRQDEKSGNQLVEGDQEWVQSVKSSDMATLDNLETIEEEEPLQKLLNDTSDFDDRKKIRSRIRALKDKKRQDREKDRLKREADRQDEIKRKFQQAQDEKQYRMKRFDELAKERTIGSSSNLVESHIKQKQQAAEEKKQKVLKEFETRAATDSIGKLGQRREEAIQVKIQVAEDLKRDKLESYSKPKGDTTSRSFTINKTKTTSSSGFGGTVYGKTPESMADSIAQKIKDESRPGTSGSVTIKQESWSSRTGLKKTETTKTWGAKPQGAKGAMAAFKQMDKSANPNSGSKPNFLGSGGGSRGGGVARSASTIKEMLLKWIQMMTKEYPIEITNFSTSWSDGLAFCALIHHFCPDAFDFNELNPKNREYNFTLAFDTAEKCADIAPLLDVEDMVRMKKPDWKCVFTYVQSFYRRFRNHESNQHTPIEQ